MKILERMIQYTDAPTDEIMAKEKKFEAVANRVGGFPPKLRYRALVGKEKGNTFVWDRLWNSLTEMEEAYAKLRQQPEMDEIRKLSPDLGSWRREIYYTIGD